MVERAGPAGRFGREEFFYAEHHNLHTQKAYMAAVRRFLVWAEGEGVELPAITPGRVGQYPVGLGGSAAKRNLHNLAGQAEPRTTGRYDRRQKKVTRKILERISIRSMIRNNYVNYANDAAS